MRTWIEIDAAAVRYNLRALRKVIGSKTALWPVIKANAYGHGFFEIAKICLGAEETDGLCVVDDEEALSLIKNRLNKLPIMILSFYELEENKIATLVKNDIILPLFSLKQARFIDKVAKRIGRKARVHIKIDTGASRIGVLANEINNGFWAEIQRLSHIDILGIFSHFASSEEDDIQTQKQLLIFKRTIEELKQQGTRLKICHIACSAAAILRPETRFNAVRIGLSLYGLYPGEKIHAQIKLKPVLTLNTKIVQIKKIAPGTKIGYGGIYTTKKATTLAVIPIGYWDGYDRGLSNKAEVLVHGRRCPIRGRICMNMAMIDVSLVPMAKVDDTVTLIGRQGKEHITADELAGQAQTINYEIVDRLNPLLPRLIK